MAEIRELSTTDASNTARFPEGQNPSTVNDGARALEGLLKRAWADSVESALVATGSSSAYVVTANRSLSSLADGMVFGFEANHTNAAAPTLNVNSLGAKSIRDSKGETLTTSALISTHKYLVVYDSSNDYYQLLSPPSTANGVLVDPTTTRGDLLARGASQLGRLAVGSANTLLKSDGTDPSWATVSAMLATISSTQGVILYYNGTAWVALATGTSGQFLKTQGAAANPTWATTTTIATGSALTQDPAAAGATVTQAHGLASAPKHLQIALECTADDNGYSTGNVVLIAAGRSDTNNSANGWSISIDATNVVLKTASVFAISIPNASTLVNTNVTLTKWKFVITPYTW